MLLLQLLLLGPNVEDQSLRLAGTAGADHTRRVTVAARQGPLLLSSGWVEVAGNAAGAVAGGILNTDEYQTRKQRRIRQGKLMFAATQRRASHIYEEYVMSNQAAKDLQQSTTEPDQALIEMSDSLAQT